MAEETATPTTAPVTPAPTTEQPAAPSAPATNQPAEASPFADGTGWDQIQRNDLVAKPEPPKEVVFADGKKMTDIDFRAQQTSAPATQTEPAKPGDTSEKSSGPATLTEPATSDTPAAATSDDEQYAGLIKKYGNDPKSWAKHFANIQERARKAEEANKAYKDALLSNIRQAPVAAPPATAIAPGHEKPAEPPVADAKLAAPAFDKSAEVAQILELLGDEPAQGIEKLLALTEALADQRGKAAAESYYRAEQERAAQQTAARQAEEIKTANEQAVWGRVREMKLAQARATNDQAAIAKYGNEKYQIDEADYIDVMPSIQSEIDFIVENNMLPKDGRLTPALFKRVQLLLDPPDIQQIISETEQRTRAKVMAEIANAQKANGGRVSLQPAATPPVKANELDFSKMDGHRTDIQDQYFSHLPDDQLAAALAKMNEALVRGAV